MKIYEKLILSDVHHPTDKKTRPNKYENLLELISYFKKNNIKFKEVILAGDIFENWYVNLKEAIKKDSSIITDLLRKLKEISLEKCYYLPGNHCSKILSYKVPKFLKLILIQEEWITQEKYENNKLVIAHGHQGQYSKLYWILGSTINIILYKLAVVIPGLYKFAEKFYSKFLDYDKVANSDYNIKIKYYNKARKRLNARDKIMIIGHTHEPYLEPSMNNVNTGDWITNCSFVLIDTQYEITVNKYDHKNKKIKSIFNFKFFYNS